MAKRGVRPKPAELRVITGTHRRDRHGEPEEALAVGVNFGKLERPSFLKGEARKAWDRYIAPASWLDKAREPAAIAFCELWAEFRQGAQDFPSSRHAQMRYYMADLGLTDERNRKSDEGDGTKDEAARYFA